LINFDEVATGALVNAIAVTGRRISMAINNWNGRRRTDQLYTARWFETYRLTGQPPRLPAADPAQMERLVKTLRDDEVQAALQELLAVRLTDAPEAEASRARYVLRQTLTILDADAAPFAATLADYYDDQICALVASLEADDPKLLAQIRLEAFASRMICILNAIERHTAAIAARPSLRTEASFLASYRSHVIDQHGKLEPPDFDRRRRVPVHDIYVPVIITEEIYLEQSSALRSSVPSLDVLKLARWIDRSVLLGDPGGGKTTAANVLMHYFASSEARWVPFLITLRDYAAKDPPERSVVEHIEHTLQTFYQSPPPPGLVDLLLLTGRAIVIFDGLDELLDTSRRADVTTRVERFCAEYPLAPVLVTSRVVGYDQARLNPDQFTTYRLGGFADEQVAKYAFKWFAQDGEAQSADAAAFLAESASVPDLRTNPLMLALLCILYRGEGFLPRNRAEVYEQCANMLFRRWDARRHIHRDLRAGHLLEPTLRHLASWLFTRDEAKTAVTERQLVAETAEFLHDRGFESEEDARDAAREFVEFCRGRMWVFTDAGTTAAGEKLYAFTHRTFLEFFAAAQLAYDSDTPEQLANTIVRKVARDEIWVLAELAIQLKDRTSNGGAQRIYSAMIEDCERNFANDGAVIMQFLALSLRSVDPSPSRVRELTRRILTNAIEAEQIGTSVSHTDLVEPSLPWYRALRQLVISCGPYRDTVADEIAIVISEMIRFRDQLAAVCSLRLAVSLPDSAAFADRRMATLWEPYADNILRAHGAAVVESARYDLYLRRGALAQGLISVRQALDMDGGLSVIFKQPTGLFSEEVRWGPYIEDALDDLMKFRQLSHDSRAMEDFAAIGNYLYNNPKLPWLYGRPTHSLMVLTQTPVPPALTITYPWPNQAAYLGVIAILAIMAECREEGYKYWSPEFGPVGEFYPYLACRRYPFDGAAGLPALQVPEMFKRIFRDWAECRIDLVASE
jgi:hypothetical protein